MVTGVKGSVKFPLGVEIIAHRGASHDAPENTLAAIDLAWRQEADAVEIDVMLTRDRRIVAVHDERLLRLAGTDVAVADLTLAELRRLDVGRWKAAAFAGERVPTLEEVLDVVPPGRRLFVEIKCGLSIVSELCALLAQRRMAEQVVPIGFSLETMLAVKEALPAYTVCHVVARRFEHGSLLPKAADIVQTAKTPGLDGVDLGGPETLDAEVVEMARAAGLEVYVWTCNSGDEALRLRDLGVHGITTDRPAHLRSILAAEARAVPPAA